MTGILEVFALDEAAGAVDAVRDGAGSSAVSSSASPNPAPQSQGPKTTPVHQRGSRDGDVLVYCHGRLVTARRFAGGHRCQCGQMLRLVA